MGRFMDRYIKYQIIASICIALFVISTAVQILAHDNKIYNKCYEKYYEENQSTEEGMPVKSPAEVALYYEQLSDSFTDFFGKDYEISGYELTKDNKDNLNELKSYYRVSCLVALVSLVAGAYCIWFISRRRMYMPFVYGGVLAAFITSVNFLVLMLSDNKVISAVRNMILKKDYGYFVEGDVLLSLFPPEYARWLAIAYVAFTVVLILLMVMLRQFIVYLGRPHKF